MKPEETDRCERVKGPKKLDLPSLGMVGEEKCYIKSSPEEMVDAGEAMAPGD